MIPLAIGVALFGIFAVRRAHHRHAWRHAGDGAWHAAGRCASDPRVDPDDLGPRWYRGRAWRRLASLYAALETTPAQERVIQREARALTELAQRQRSMLRDGRGDLGRAIAGDAVDDAALEAALARADEGWAELRRATAASVRAVHEVLDPEQRTRLARWLGGGGVAGRGPFR